MPIATLKNRLLFPALGLALCFAAGTAQAEPPSPDAAAEAKAKELCFDPNVGRPVPCTSMHSEEAKPDIPNFMTPHEGPRSESKAQ